MTFLGALAAVLAALLIVLPTVRVLQGRLAPELALGLWIAGAGFLLLGLAALALSGDAALVAALAGVAATVAGNVIQRRRTRPPRGTSTLPPT